MERIIAYIAGPYGHESQAVVNQRYGQHSSATARIFENVPEVDPYSPISWTHNLQRFLSRRKVPDEVWYEFDERFLRRFADVVLVLMLDGWERSVGVKREVKLAEKLGIPVLYAKLVDVEDVLREYLKNVGGEAGVSKNA